MNIHSSRINIIRWIYSLEDLTLALLLGVLIVLACLQILLRNVFGFSLLWIDPLLRNLVLWLGLLGALAASRSGKHVSIDLVGQYLHGHWKELIYALTSVFTAVVCAIIAWFSSSYVRLEMEIPSTLMLGIPQWVLTSIIPFTFFLIAVRYAIFAVQHGICFFRSESVV